MQNCLNICSFLVSQEGNENDYIQDQKHERNYYQFGGGGGYFFYCVFSLFLYYNISIHVYYQQIIIRSTMKYPVKKPDPSPPPGQVSSQHQSQNLQSQSHISDQSSQQSEHNAQQEQELFQDNNEVDKSQRGVVYMSRIPPFMTPNRIRKLLSQFSIERIYLLPETQWVRQNRIKKGGSKRICFREGWIQFTDKKVGRMVATSLNGNKMSHKKGDFYSQDLWNLKYLPKFKWHNLTQRLAHQQRLKKERLRVELEQEKKVQEFYLAKVQKSKLIKGIVRKKERKERMLKQKTIRSAKQLAMLNEEEG